MQCKRCNAHIPEGFMYCPECGEEIIIVSEFDINLEDNIDTVAVAQTVELPDLKNEHLVQADENPSEETQLNIIENISSVNKSNSNNHNKSNRQNHNKKSSEQKNRNKALIIILACVIGIIILTGIFVTIKKVNEYNDYDYQIEKASIELNDRDYDGAIKTLKHARDISETLEVILLLSQSYIDLVNYDAAIAVLYEGLELYPGDISLYDKIVQCYEAQNNSKGIHDLIMNSNDSNLALRYNSYISISPTFSLESGEYIEPDPIKLSANGNGTIYYTTDGSVPTSDNLEYMGPIPLEYGTTVITAIYVNEKGIISEPVSHTYDVEMNIPDTPVLTVASGKKTVPDLIGVDVDEDVEVYYTTDGNEPTNLSKRYTKKILMPIGKSSFRFIAYNSDGNCSDVVEGSYELSMNGAIDTSVAEYAIAFQLLSKGENVVANTYVTEYGYYENNNVYYVIVEYMNSSATGRMFAVDINSGDLHYLNEKNGNYTLELL